MRRIFSKILSAMIVASGTLSCGGSNYFTPMSSKSSDAAILEDVQKLNNQQRWDEAIARIADMSSGARSSPEVVKAEAGAHAGKCGLNLVQFMEGIGSGPLFQSFMVAFANKTTNIAECQAAQTIIESRLGVTASARLSSLPSRTAADFNTFMAILGMVKIGVQLKARADLDADGNMDAGWDACDMMTADNARDIKESEVAQVGSGFGLILDNFTAIAANLGGSADGLADLQDQCDDLSPNPCLVTDPNSATWATAGAQLALRGLIQSDSIGIGACNEANALECCIP